MESSSPSLSPSRLFCSHFHSKPEYQILFCWIFSIINRSRFLQQKIILVFDGYGKYLGAFESEKSLFGSCYGFLCKSTRLVPFFCLITIGYHNCKGYEVLRPLIQCSKNCFVSIVIYWCIDWMMEGPLFKAFSQIKVINSILFYLHS